MRISDWSSDVCSSDLAVSSKPAFYLNRVRALLMTTLFFNANLFMHIRDLLKADGLHWSPRAWGRLFRYLWIYPGSLRKAIPAYLDWSSEERRVGKECVSPCSSRWSPYHQKKKK